MPKNNVDCCENCLIPCKGSYCSVPSLCWKNLEMTYTDKFNVSQSVHNDWTNRFTNNNLGITYSPGIGSGFRDGSPVYETGLRDVADLGNNVNNPTMAGLPGNSAVDGKCNRNTRLGEGFNVGFGYASSNDYWTPGGIATPRETIFPTVKNLPFRIVSMFQTWNIRSKGKVCVYRKDNFPEDNSFSPFTKHIENWGLFTELEGEVRFGFKLNLLDPSFSQTYANVLGSPTGAQTGLANTLNIDNTNVGILSPLFGTGIPATFNNSITATTQSFEWSAPASVAWVPLDRKFNGDITRVIGSDTFQMNTETLPFISFHQVTAPDFLYQLLGNDFLGQQYGLTEVLNLFAQKKNFLAEDFVSAVRRGDRDILKNLLFNYFTSLFESLTLFNGKISAYISFHKNQPKSNAPTVWTGPIVGESQTLFLTTPSCLPCYQPLVPFRKNQAPTPTKDDDDCGCSGDNTSSSGQEASSSNLEMGNFNDEDGSNCFNKHNPGACKIYDCKFCTGKNREEVIRNLSENIDYCRGEPVQYFLPRLGQPIPVTSTSYGTALVCGYFGQCRAGCSTGSCCDPCPNC